jgi:hypothetical protein
MKFKVSYVPTERQVLFLLNLGSVINYWVSVFVLVGVRSIVAVICYAWILASGERSGRCSGDQHATEQDGGVQAGSLAPLSRWGRHVGTALFRHHVIFDLNTPCCGVLRLTRP